MDDNKDNRTLIRTYLKNTSHKIIEAENGKIAIDKFKSDHFDIVIMDIQLPIKNGYEATTEIRNWERENGLLSVICGLSC